MIKTLSADGSKNVNLHLLLGAKIQPAILFIIKLPINFIIITPIQETEIKLCNFSDTNLESI